MNNVFANLAARARATEPVIRPNLVSRFEPAPHASNEPTETAVEIDAPHPASRPTVESAPPPPPLSVTHPTPPPMLARDASIVRSAEPPPPPLHAARENPEEKVVTPVSPATPVIVAAAPTPTLPVATPPAAAPVVTSIVSSAPVPPTLAPVATVRVEKPEAPTPSAAVRSAPAAPAVTAPARELRPSHAGEPPTLPRFASPPMFVSRDMSPAARQAKSEAVTAPVVAAPEVHVTIGRLEIRAVVPPAPAPREVAATPAARISLDDYLRNSAKGGAR
ncbi:MAG TPA: hypothetical protein VFJ90_08445 [Candidatus Didemnitutus sp.]|nr:hypothetical protein [Candidatus Didemnitutus sp.]